MLAGSNNYLRSQNFFFPKLPKMEQSSNSIWLSPFRHNIIASTYADYASAFNKLTREQLKLFWENLATNDCAPILSAEDFSRQRNYKFLADDLDLGDYEPEVVMYVRRQDLFMESLYNQRNKILVSRGEPWFLSEDFLTEQDVFRFIQRENYIPVLNFANTLARMDAQLSPKKIHVRIFDRSLMKDGDVCADFANIFGWKMDKMFQPGREANGSISNTVLQQLKRAFLEEGETAARTVLADINEARKTGKDLSGSYKIFCDRTRQNIQRQYSEINENLYKAYGIIFPRNWN